MTDRRGAAPGTRRGGRAKGTPNKKTQLVRAEKILAEARAAELVPDVPQWLEKLTPEQQEELRTWDSLLHKKLLYMRLMEKVEAAEKEDKKRMEADPPEPPQNTQFVVDTIIAASNILTSMLPYEHRRLAQSQVNVNSEGQSIINVIVHPDDLLL